MACHHERKTPSSNPKLCLSPFEKRLKIQRFIGIMGSEMESFLRKGYGKAEWDDPRFRESINQSVDLGHAASLSPESTANWKKAGIHLVQSSKNLHPLRVELQDIKRISLQGPFNKESDSEEGDAVRDNHHLHLYLLPKSLHSAHEAGQTPKYGNATGGFEDYYYFWKAPNNDDLLRRICGLFHWNSMMSCKNWNCNHLLCSTRAIILMRCGWMKSRKFPRLQEIQAPQPLNQRISKPGKKFLKHRRSSLLLQLNPEYYERVESGEITPDEELLKDLCALPVELPELIKEERRSSFKDFHLGQNQLKKEAFMMPIVNWNLWFVTSMKTGAISTVNNNAFCWIS